MKNLVILIALLTSATLFAHPGKNTKVVTSYTTVLLSRNFPMNEVCIENDQMRTKKLQKICTKTVIVGNRDNDRRECVKYKYEYASKPLQYEAKECVRYVRRGSSENRRKECVKFQTVTKHLPLTYTKTTKLYRWVGSHNNGDWEFPGKILSQVKLNVPYCK